jgi:hypothetical protein
MRFLFWNVDFERLDLERHEAAIMARVLERGRLTDVQWLIRAYGLTRIHRFLRELGHPEVSARTIAFWRAVFEAGEEEWASPPDWRRSSSAPWID